METTKVVKINGVIVSIVRLLQSEPLEIVDEIEAFLRERQLARGVNELRESRLTDTTTGA